MPRTVPQIKDLVNHLKAQGVRRYKDKECELEFGGATPANSVTVEPRVPRRPDPQFPDVDPDMFGHEGH